ncbi:MAG: RNA polymerase sigma factor, partial [Caulobacteraceae bacterium]
MLPNAILPAARPVEAVQADVRAAIVAFMPRLRRFAFSLCGSRAQADDLVQDTVERALARLDQWKPDTRLESWLCAITRNLWIDETRRRKRRGPHVDVDEALDLASHDGRQVVGNRDMARRAVEAFMALPEESRALASLVILNGVSYRDAAQT